MRRGRMSLALFTLAICWAGPAWSGPAEEQLAAAAKEQKYTYLVFYRQADAATRAMQEQVAAQVARRPQQTSAVSVRVDDPAEAAVVRRYDATRLPLPCVMGIAPNGAVTGTYPLTVQPEQLERAILTPRYAEMVKALQEQKIVLLCLQPAQGGAVPRGITELEAEAAFRGRTRRVVACADDPAEARFFERMHVPTSLSSPVTIVFAPPGAFIGKFDAAASGAAIAQKLHASGKCNCEHCQHQRK